VLSCDLHWAGHSRRHEQVRHTRSRLSQSAPARQVISTRESGASGLVPQRIASPGAEWLVTRYLGTVEGEPVPALVGDPPAAVGERESCVLPGYRGHVGEH